MESCSPLFFENDDHYIHRIRGYLTEEESQLEPQPIGNAVVPNRHEALEGEQGGSDSERGAMATS